MVAAQPKAIRGHTTSSDCGSVFGPCVSQRLAFRIGCRAVEHDASLAAVERDDGRRRCASSPDYAATGRQRRDAIRRRQIRAPHCNADGRFIRIGAAKIVADLEREAVRPRIARIRRVGGLTGCNLQHYNTV